MPLPSRTLRPAESRFGNNKEEALAFSASNILRKILGKEIFFRGCFQQDGADH